MSYKVKIQDHQEIPASDYMRIQDARIEQFDNFFGDAVHDGKSFAGFGIVPSGAAGLIVGDGRLYINRKEYSRPGDTVATFNLATGSVTLPVFSKKIISIIGWGTTRDTQTTPREFSTAVTDTNGTYTGEYTVESRDVPITTERFANIDLLEGPESANPQPPTIGAQYVEIARILCNSTGIESISFVEENRLETVRDLDLRAKSLERDRDATTAAIGSIISDIGSIRALLASLPRAALIDMFARDIARLKEQVGRPDTATAYGAITFGTSGEMDLAHAQSNCRIDGTLTFPAQAIKEALLAFSNPNEPLVVKKGSLTLPIFNEVVVIDTMAGLVTQ